MNAKSDECDDARNVSVLIAIHLENYECAPCLSGCVQNVLYAQNSRVCLLFDCTSVAVCFVAKLKCEHESIAICTKTEWGGGEGVMVHTVVVDREQLRDVSCDTFSFFMVIYLFLSSAISLNVE